MEKQFNLIFNIQLKSVLEILETQIIFHNYYNLHNKMSSEAQHGIALNGGLYSQLPQGPSRGGGRDYFSTGENDGLHQRGHLGMRQPELPHDVFIHQPDMMSDQGHIPGQGETQGLGPHDTLLSQYKKCSRINNEQLRNARNLEQLVGIKVHAIDGRLGTSGQAAGRLVDGVGEVVGQPMYDFKFDPLHFRQKVPCMADRSFLINQAILSSSTQMPRLGFQGANAAGRIGTASTGTSFGPGYYPGPKGSPPFSGISTSSNQHRDRGAADPRRGHPAAFGSRGLGSLRADERLFSGGFDSTSHGGAGTAGSAVETQELFGGDFRAQNGLVTGPGTSKAADQHGRPKRGGEDRPDLNIVEPGDQAAGSHTQADSRQGGSNDGQDSPTDPINALKSIFKPKERSKRAPLDLNPVMNKYRQRHHTTSQRIRSVRTGAAGGSRTGSKYGNPLNQLRPVKVFKEDMNPLVNAGGAALMSSQTDRLKEYSSQGMTPYQQDAAARAVGGPDYGKQFQEGSHEELMEGKLNALQAGQQPGAPAFGYGSLRSSHQMGLQAIPQLGGTREQEVKEKLENLRKLFAEEDINETVKGIQHDWELEDQKIADKKPGLFQSKFNSTQPYNRIAEPGMLDQGPDVSNNDLRGYLTRKIKQIQDRSDPQNLHEDLVQDQQRPLAQNGEEARAQYTFKASTLTHIAELRNVGQEKIENQFIERLFREQTDYHFERYAHGKQKAFTKQAAAIKHRNVHQATGLITEVGDPGRVPGASRGSHSQRDGQESAGKARSRQKKPVNIVQEQMLKIERINRESENRNKQLQQEVRNTEIYDIIKDTQEEISRMRQEQDLDGTLGGDLGELAARSRQEASANLQAVTAGFKPGEQPGPERRLDPQMRDQRPLGSERLIAIQKSNEEQPKEPQAQASHHEMEQAAHPGAGGVQATAGLEQPTELGSAEGALMEQPGARPKAEDHAPPDGVAAQKKAPQPGIPDSYANKTITSKVNIHSVMNVDMKDVQQEGNQFRVSQLVQAYNEQQRAESPVAEPLCLSDTELFMSSTRNYLRGRLSPESRGGGFRDRRPRPGAAGQQAASMNKQLDEREAIAKHEMMRANKPGGQRRPLGQIDEEPLDITHGNSFSYFCPKRFNRYPRFTIFFKRDRAAMSNQYIMENTVSLSPQFLSYLMDKNGANLRQSSIPQDAGPRSSSLDNQNQQISQGQTGASLAAGESVVPRRPAAEDADAHQNLERLQADGTAGPRANASPTEEAVTGWNQKNEMVQNYDPFEKVVLVKGIDNSILTSFRTLKRENNTVSDTFKIVHQKFLPSKHKGLYFKSIQKNQADKLTLYPHTDNEDALDVAHAELLAESLLHQVDDSRLMNEDQQRQFELAQLPSQHQQRQPAGTAALSSQERMAGAVQGGVTGAGQGIKVDRREDALLMPSAARPQALLLNNKYRSSDGEAKIEIPEDDATNQNQKHGGDAKHPVAVIRANVVNQRAHAQGAAGAAAKQIDGIHQKPDDQPGSVGQKGQLAVGPIGQRQSLDAANPQMGRAGHPTQAHMWMNKSAVPNAVNIDQNKALRPGEHEMLASSAHNFPAKNVVGGAGRGTAAARGGHPKVTASNYLSNGEHSNASFLRGQKLQSQLFKATTDSCNDINLQGQLPHLVGGKGGAEVGGGQGLGEKDGSPKRDASYGDSVRVGPNRNQFKHQIEVMVLSKVDPLDSAFPGAANISESNLSNSFLQAAPSNIMVGTKQGGLPNTAGAGPVYHQGMIPPSSKRNPFKNGPALGGQYAISDKPVQLGAQGPVGSAAPRPAKQAAAAPKASRGNVPAGSGSLKKMNTAQGYPKVSMNQNRDPTAALHDGLADQGSLPPSQALHPALDSKTVAGARHQMGSPSKTKQDPRAVRPSGSAPKDETKYGKDFKIPELPPLLQQHLFGDDTASDPENLAPAQPNPWFSPSAGAGNTQYKIKKFIDDIYQKEMKYRYHRQYVREDFLLTQSPIFNLEKSHHLRPKGDLLSKGLGMRPKGKARMDKGQKGAAVNDLGQPVLHSESESLTNVLGFQAGGPHVVVPVHNAQSHNGPHYFTGQQNGEQEAAGPQGRPTLQYPAHQLVAPGGGVYNANQIYFGTNTDGTTTGGVPVNGGSTNVASALQSPGTRKARQSTEARPKADDEEGADGDLASPPDNDQEAMLRPAGDDPASALVQPEASAKVIKSSDREL